MQEDALAIEATTLDESEQTPNGDQTSGREQLLTEMLLARTRARRRARMRLLAATGVIANIALVVLLSSGQLYQVQLTGVTAQSTAAAGKAAVETATEFYKSQPYVAAMPGDCGPQNTQGSWSPTAGQGMQVVCETDIDVTSVSASAKNTAPSTLRLTLAHTITSAYTLDVNISFTSLGTCAGLVSSGQTSTNSMYIFELCDNGKWQILFVQGSSAPKVLARGAQKLLDSDQLTVQASSHRLEFSIDGHSVKVISIARSADTTPDFVGISVRNGTGLASGTVSAEFNAFKYQPNG